jgi:hypothetical protein
MASVSRLSHPALLTTHSASLHHSEGRPMASNTFTPPTQPRAWRSHQESLLMQYRQPRPYPPQGPGSYLQNGNAGPVPGARPLLPDNGRIIQAGPTRVLCIADVRGKRPPHSHDPN